MYYDRTTDIDILEQKIREEVENFNLNYSESISASINHKLLENIQKCYHNNGGHIEN